MVLIIKETTFRLSESRLRRKGLFKELEYFDSLVYLYLYERVLR